MSLLDQGTREDAPTCETPRNCVWEYVDQWELIEGRDCVELSENGVSLGSATKTEHIPDLPDSPDMLFDAEPQRI
jgi:hypothetical protein